MATCFLPLLWQALLFRNGNVTQHTDFNGQVTKYAYDSNNWQTLKLKPDNSRVTTTYTASGLIKTETDSRGVTTYTYDANDRLTKKQTPEGTLSYAYDRNGNRTQVTTTSGTVKYQFDELNRLASVTDQGNKQTTYQYDDNGNRQRVSYPNNTTTTYEYDVNNRLKKLAHKTTDTQEVLAEYRYTLKPNGMREKLVEFNSSAAANSSSPDRVVSYTYDALYRLTEEKVETRSGGTLSASRISAYAYDNTGNRLTKTETASGTTTVSYSYDSNDRLLTETSGSTTSTYTYDNNGNTTKKAMNGSAPSVALYGFDSDNRLISLKQGASEGGAVLVASYAYDPDGNRATVTAAGSTTSYLVDTNQQYAQVLEESLSGSAIGQASYIYGDDLLSQTRGGQQSFYHYDGLGSTRVLTATSGEIASRYDYEAFGSIEQQHGSTPNTYLYTGEQLDRNTGFYYLRARYSNAGIGRFISSDLYQGQAREPASLHKYVYVQNDPVLCTDPSGNFLLIGLNVRVSQGAYANAIAANVARVTANRAAGKAFEKFVEGQLRAFTTRYGGEVVKQVYFRGPGGVRFADFVVKVGDKFVAVEVKTGIPMGGGALVRLANQLKTFVFGASPNAVLAGTATDVIVITEESVAALEASYAAIEAQLSAGTVSGIIGGTNLLMTALRGILLGF